MSLTVVAGMFASLLGVFAAPGPAGAVSATVSIPGSPWTGTGVAVIAGETVSISASGTINIGNSSVANGGLESPDGAVCGLDGFPLPSAPCWSMIGQLGSEVFAVGSSSSFIADTSGELLLGINDNFYGDNSGSWTAHVHAGSALTITPGVSPAPVVTSSLSGAPVSFTVPTAGDLRGSVPVTCAVGELDVHPGDVFPIGATTVTCSAYNADDSPPSVQSTLTVTVNLMPEKSSPPTNVYATAGDQSISVSFGPPVDQGTSGVYSYSVACGSSNGGTPGATDGPGSPLMVTGLSDGYTYTCNARATTAAGSGATSQPSNAVVPGVSVTCTNTQTCDAKTSTPSSAANPPQNVEVKGTPTDPVGTVDVTVAPVILNCPGVPNVFQATTSLTDTGFPASSSLQATVKQLAVSTGPGRICYSSDVPFLSVTNPTIPKAGTGILLQCSQTGNVAPCQLSSQQTSNSVVVSFLVPGGDPLFKVVEPKGRLLWPSSFPTGVVGSPFSVHLQSSGGKAPIHWKIVSRTLPPGLTLNPSTGVITGKPTKKGVFGCVAQATDSESPPKSAKIAVSITVK